MHTGGTVFNILVVGIQRIRNSARFDMIGCECWRLLLKSSTGKMKKSVGKVAVCFEVPSWTRWTRWTRSFWQAVSERGEKEGDEGGPIHC